MKKKLEESIASSHGNRGAFHQPPQTQHHDQTNIAPPSSIRALPQPQQQPSPQLQPIPPPSNSNPFLLQSQPSPSPISSTPPQQPPRGPNAQARPMPPIQAGQSQPASIHVSGTTNPTFNSDATHTRETSTVFGSIQNNPFLQQQNQNQANQASSSLASPTAKKTTRRADPSHSQPNQHEGMPF
jgi:hypothetical protein